jgi:hypothetical protein
VPAAFKVDTAGHTEEEQVTLLASHWWSPAELAATDEELWPANLLDLLGLVRSPDVWPVALPAVEESSVPA